jgi:hypothetical protein
MASYSMWTTLVLTLRRGSGLPKSRKRGFKNTSILKQNDRQAHRTYRDSFPRYGSGNTGKQSSPHLISGHGAAKLMGRTQGQSAEVAAL